MHPSLRMAMAAALVATLAITPGVYAAADQGPAPAPAPPAPAAATSAASGGSTTTIQFQLPEQDKLNHATAASISYLFSDEGSPFAGVVEKILGGLTDALYGYLTIVPRLMPGSDSNESAAMPFAGSLISPQFFGALWRVGFVCTILVLGFDLVLRAGKRTLDAATGEAPPNALASDLFSLLVAALAGYLSFMAMDQIHHLINLFDRLLMVAAAHIGIGTQAPQKPGDYLGAVWGGVDAVVVWKTLGFLALPLALCALFATIAVWVANIGRLAILLVLVATAPFAIFCLFRGWRGVGMMWLTQYRNLLIAAPLSTVLLIIITYLGTAVLGSDAAKFPLFGLPAAIAHMLMIIATIGLLAGANMVFFKSTFGEAAALVASGQELFGSVGATFATGAALKAGLTSFGQRSIGALASESGGSFGLGSHAFAGRINEIGSGFSRQQDAFTAPIRESRPYRAAQQILDAAGEVWAGSEGAPGLASQLADTMSLGPSPQLGRVLASTYGSARALTASHQAQARRDAETAAREVEHQDRQDSAASTELLRDMFESKDQTRPGRDANVARTLRGLHDRGLSAAEIRQGTETLDDSFKATAADRQRRHAADPSALQPADPRQIRRSVWDSNDAFQATAGPRHADEAMRMVQGGFLDLAQHRPASTESRAVLAGSLRALQTHDSEFEPVHYMGAQQLLADSAAQPSPEQIVDTARLVAQAHLRDARSAGWTRARGERLGGIAQDAYDQALGAARDVSADDPADRVAAVQQALREHIRARRS